LKMEACVSCIPRTVSLPPNSYSAWWRCRQPRSGV